MALKKPVFGGACKICPWGAIGDIVKELMAPYGYDVQVCYNCNNVRFVAEGLTGPPAEETLRNHPTHPAIATVQIPQPPKAPVDFGATNAQGLWSAYEGSAATPGRKNLRLIAVIQSPVYFIVAVRSELGITDLGQIKDRRLAVRILGAGDGSQLGGPAGAVLGYYGLTRQVIESAGGRFLTGSEPADRRNGIDVVIGNGTLAGAPEYDVWYELSQRYNLTYMRLPDDLLDRLAKEASLERRDLPNGLLRGIDHPIPSVARTGHAIFGRDDMPDEFAYTVAKALDEHQDRLQWSHLNLSYNPRTVWKASGVPLHPGAARYYRERGYMK